MIRAVVRLATVALIAAFVALGIWQLDRRAWKLDLIQTVERNMAAPPAPAPPAIGPDDAYRRLSATGHYLSGDTLTQAVTEAGGGHWVLTPLATPAGTLLVNRGFVGRGATPAPPPAGVVTVTGLARPSEPDGGFLRANDPGAGRWYSRDVAAIARARGLPDPLPYFIDAVAGAPGTAAPWPRGGMTVVAFRNTHLVYALTWFAMAALLAFLAWRARRAR